MAIFDIVIPTLEPEAAGLLVAQMMDNAVYDHNYIVMAQASPLGYTYPCNKGYRAGDHEVVCFVNDDITVGEEWDFELVKEYDKGTYCFGPWTPTEANMRLNGWFLCLRRDYIDHYGYAFDPQFKVWCGDIDLIKRLEADDIEPVLVRGCEIEHSYSKTCSMRKLQDWIVPQQQMDLYNYTKKWGTDPNEDKVR